MRQIITIWQVGYDDGNPSLWVAAEHQALALQEEAGDTASIAPVAFEMTEAGVIDMLNKLERGQLVLLEPLSDYRPPGAPGSSYPTVN
jgi:hypothetical protein